MVDWEEILYDYLAREEDVFNTLIENLDAWNGYLGDDRYYDMYDLDEFLSDKTPTEILELVNEDFNISDDYFKWDCYGLHSNWRIDYSDHLDEYFIGELVEEYNHLGVEFEEVTALINHIIEERETA